MKLEEHLCITGKVVGTAAPVHSEEIFVGRDQLWLGIMELHLRVQHQCTVSAWQSKKAANCRISNTHVRLPNDTPTLPV
jgi:hypothetical protein